MASPHRVSQAEYDKLRSDMEDKYDYENMTDEEKDTFDRTFDQMVTAGDKNDPGDKNDGEDREDREFDDGIPHEQEDDERTDEDDDPDRDDDDDMVL